MICEVKHTFYGGTHKVKCACGWQAAHQGYHSEAMKIKVLQHYVENLRNLLSEISCPNCGQLPIVTINDDLTKHS